MMKHFSVSIAQHLDGTATVAFTSPSGRVYRTVVSADRAVLFSAYLVGWDRDGLLFNEDGDMDFIEVSRVWCGVMDEAVMV